MRRCLLLCLLFAGCEFNLPGTSDLWPCDGGGGDVCDRNGNPISPMSGGSTGSGTTGAASSSTSSAETSGGGASTTTGTGTSTGTSTSTQTTTGTPTSTGTTGGTTGGGTTAGTSSGTTSSGGTTGCPPQDGGVVYVDPLAGSDATGTGVANPPACAFRTLTHAFQWIPGSGLATVEAIGGSMQNPAIFNADGGESFPLTVPPGVALTTDLEQGGNGGASASAYDVALDDPADGTQIVWLSAAASISGFQVELTPAGNSGADAIDCSGGMVSIRDCVLIGTGDTYSVGITLGAGSAACDASIVNLSVQGFGEPGLVVGSGSAAIDGGTFTGNGLAGGSGYFGSQCEEDGILLLSGSLNLANVTLSSNQDYGLGVVSGTVTGSQVAIRGSGFAGPDTQGGLGLGVIGSVGGPPGCTTPIPSTGSVVLSDVSIESVASDGVDVAGGTLALLGNVSIIGNGGNGVELEGGDLYLENPTVQFNGICGVTNEVGAGSIALDGGTVGPDVQAQNCSEIAMPGSASLTLNGTTVHDNPLNDGIHFEGSGPYALTNCDVTGNASAGLDFVAGTLAVFAGNRIHDNRGNQILVEQGDWDLGGDQTCAEEPNAVYCYAGSYGILVQNGSVIADDLIWENATPTPGVDYEGAVTVDAGQACAAITGCP